MVEATALILLIYIPHHTTPPSYQSGLYPGNTRIYQAGYSLILSQPLELTIYYFVETELDELCTSYEYASDLRRYYKNFIRNLYRGTRHNDDEYVKLQDNEIGKIYLSLFPQFLDTDEFPRKYMDKKYLLCYPNIIKYLDYLKQEKRPYSSKDDPLANVSRVPFKNDTFQGTCEVNYCQIINKSYNDKQISDLDNLMKIQGGGLRIISVFCFITKNTHKYEWHMLISRSTIHDILSYILNLPPNQRGSGLSMPLHSAIANKWKKPYVATTPTNKMTDIMDVALRRNEIPFQTYDEHQFKDIETEWNEELKHCDMFNDRRGRRLFVIDNTQKLQEIWLNTPRLETTFIKFTLLDTPIS